jgi:hypothetical protein
MILGKYSLGRLHLNCHQIGRLEISQNNEYGVWPSWWIMCLFQHSWPWSTITQDITFIQKYETTSTWLKVDLMTGLRGNHEYATFKTIALDNCYLSLSKFPNYLRVRLTWLFHLIIFLPISCLALPIAKS